MPQTVAGSPRQPTRATVAGTLDPARRHAPAPPVDRPRPGLRRGKPGPRRPRRAADRSALRPGRGATGGRLSARSFIRTGRPRPRHGARRRLERRRQGRLGCRRQQTGLLAAQGLCHRLGQYPGTASRASRNPGTGPGPGAGLGPARSARLGCRPGPHHRHGPLVRRPPAGVAGRRRRHAPTHRRTALARQRDPGRRRLRPAGRHAPAPRPPSTTTPSAPTRPSGPRPRPPPNCAARYRQPCWCARPCGRIRAAGRAATPTSSPRMATRRKSWVSRAITPRSMRTWVQTTTKPAPSRAISTPIWRARPRRTPASAADALRAATQLKSRRKVYSERVATLQYRFA